MILYVNHGIYVNTCKHRAIVLYKLSHEHVGEVVHCIIDNQYYLSPRLSESTGQSQ